MNVLFILYFILYHTHTQAGPLQGQYECIIYTVFYFIYHAIMHRLNECNLVIKCSVTGENVGKQSSAI
jgi:hypothetical protein